MDRSSEKHNVANSSHRAPEGHAHSCRLPELSGRAVLGDSLTLGFPPLSHSGGLLGSEWHNGVCPA